MVKLNLIILGIYHIADDCRGRGGLKERLTCRATREWFLYLSSICPQDLRSGSN